MFVKCSGRWELIKIRFSKIVIMLGNKKLVLYPKPKEEKNKKKAEITDPQPSELEKHGSIFFE